MTSLYKITILLIVSSLSFPCLANEPGVHGLIIKLTSNEVERDMNVHRYLKSKNIKTESFYPTLKIWILKLPNTIGVGESRKICSEIMLFPDIDQCEPDQKLKTNSIESECKNLRNENSNFEELVSSGFKIINPCPLIRNDHLSQYESELSPFWAQEMTGADIVREELKKKNLIELPEGLIEIWDSSSEFHGELVSGLISHESETALIPLSNNKPFKDLNSTSDYVGNYLNYQNECVDNDKCPQFINNSMVWFNSSIIGEIFSNMAQKGTVSVIAAGNEASLIDPEMTRQSENENVILVTSVDPRGQPSEFTSYGTEALISAPSDDLVMSTDYKGVKHRFGGTSGAAPQVTAALAAFSLISDYDLSVPEAKRLLRKSALRFPHMPTPNLLGHGILNTLKISEIAKRLKNGCQKETDKKNCMKEFLSGEEVFIFNESNELFEDEIKAAFPFCAKDGGTQFHPVDCRKQEQLFIKIRRHALLNPTAGDWNLISCIYKNSGFSKNALFYDEMEAIKNKSNIEIQKIAIASPEREKILKFLLGKENYTEELEEYLLKNIEGLPELQRNRLLRSVTSINGDSLIQKLLQKKKLSPDLYKSIASAIASSSPQVQNIEKYIDLFFESSINNKDMTIEIINIIDRYELVPTRKQQYLNRILDDKHISNEVLGRLSDALKNTDSKLAADITLFERILNHPNTDSGVATNVVVALAKYKNPALNTEELIQTAISKGAHNIFFLKALIEMKQSFPNHTQLIQKQIEKSKLESHQFYILKKLLDQTNSMTIDEKQAIKKTILHLETMSQ